MCYAYILYELVDIISLWIYGCLSVWNVYITTINSGAGSNDVMLMLIVMPWLQWHSGVGSDTNSSIDAVMLSIAMMLTLIPAMKLWCWCHQWRHDANVRNTAIMSAVDTDTMILMMLGMIMPGATIPWCRCQCKHWYIHLFVIFGKSAYVPWTYFWVYSY